MQFFNSVCGSGARLAALAGLAASCSCGVALAAPVTEPWPVDGPDDTSAVAAAAFSGWYAAADAFEDNVEVRDVRRNPLRTVTRAEITALLPWMSLDGGPDGPAALAWTVSGRVLYILVVDDTAPGDGLGSDAVLKYDVPSGTLSVFARLDAFNSGAAFAHLGMVHHRGRLYVGTAGGAGIRVYAAGANTTTGALTATIALPSGTSVRGLSVDRDFNHLYSASETGVWRSSLGAFPTVTFNPIAGGGDIRGLAWGDHFGGPGGGTRGLYIVKGAAGTGTGRLESLTAAQAQGFSVVTPVLYASEGSAWHGAAFTADGKLLVAADEDAVLITDSADPNLGFDAWMADEFAQHVLFARGLIAPDGAPSGWVIDADVDGVQQVNRFHPATPDGAAWAVFTLLLSDHVNDDAGAQADVRAILTRHAAPPPAGPVRSVDGIFKHWLDPDNGDTRGTWPDEHATLSTMKIVAAAARAMVYYPDDPEIVRAASRIIFGTRNWDAYLQQSPPTDALSFRGRMIGGPDGTSWARPFHEGIIFAEQAGVYDGAAARASAARWFDRTRWNNDNRTATYLTGYPLTSTASGRFESAFVSLYGALISKPYRNDPSPAGWRAQVRNLRWSSAAWTDDNAARYYTVFSAGTTPTGYNADSLAGGGHPADIATFTSLEALCAFGDTAEAVGAYAAYRKGARETFKGGARLLYRRANDPAQWAFTPNSAGLPDVSLGGVGLAELLSPGSIDAVLAVDYPLVEQCPSDRNADGSIDVEDLYRHLSAPTDLNGDEALTAQDAACLRAWLRRNESGDASTR